MIDEERCPKCLCTKDQSNAGAAKHWWDPKEYAECPDCDPDGKSKREGT